MSSTGNRVTKKLHSMFVLSLRYVKPAKCDKTDPATSLSCSNYHTLSTFKGSSMKKCEMSHFLNMPTPQVDTFDIVWFSYGVQKHSRPKMQKLRKAGIRNWETSVHWVVLDWRGRKKWKQGCLPVWKSFHPAFLPPPPGPRMVLTNEREGGFSNLTRQQFTTRTW